MGRHSIPDDESPDDDDIDGEYGAGDVGGFGDVAADAIPSDYYAVGDDGDDDPVEFTEYPDYTEYSDDDDFSDDPYADYADGTPEAPQYAAATPAPASTRSHRSDGELTGSHRIVAQGRRGVSRGVVIALITVVAVVGVFILWRFIGGVLTDRSKVAAGTCLEGEVAVSVVADPAIAGSIAEFAERFNTDADPVGDHCPAVTVVPADSRTVVAGLTGEWPTDLGPRPALWIPGSSASLARVQTALGPQQIASDSSLAVSPVLLAVHPELKDKLADQSWQSLPDLQTTPASLDGIGLPGWGSLRLALPVTGDSDASVLAAEAVSTTEGGTGAVRALIAAQPEGTAESADPAFEALLAGSDPAASKVHAVVTTEQQLFARTSDLDDAGSKVVGWLPPDPVAVADFPAVQFKDEGLSGEQMSATSQFERFLREPDQQAALAAAGFRVEGQSTPDSDVVDFGAAIGNRLSVGDAAARAGVANVLDVPAGGGTTSIMLDRSLDSGAVAAALNPRITALSPSSSVGLTTFDGSASTTAITVGPLSEDIDGTPRRDVLVSTLDGLSSSPGGAVSFTTLRNVLGEAQADYVPGQVNSILVITSGPHTDQSLSSEGLLDLVRSGDPATPIAINVLNVGDDPDADTWRQVAEISGGSYHAVPASTSPEFSAAVDQLLR